MTKSVQQGLIARRTWTEEEIAQAEVLLKTCNNHEDLYIKLTTVMLRHRPGDETNDFLYYAGDKLVGLLSLDDHGQEDREMTGMVHPDYRRRGIFSAMLKAAKLEAKQRGIERLILVCERFSRSGQAFIAAIGAKYDFSEHKMVLETFNERGPYRERIQIRLASSEDVEALASISAISFGRSVEGARLHTIASMDFPNCRYYLAKLGERTVGAFNIFFSDDECGIYGVGVLPEYRGRAFGRQMLEQLIINLHAEGWQQRIALEVETDNTNAIGLYRSLGFKEVTTFGYYNLDIV